MYEVTLRETELIALYLLPVLAPFTLHHEIIWVIWHLALAIPSKYKPQIGEKENMQQKLNQKRPFPFYQYQETQNERALETLKGPY